MSKSKNKKVPKGAANMKRWTRLEGEHSWTMFKVVSEFVEGFEKLRTLDSLKIKFYYYYSNNLNSLASSS